MLVRPTDLSPEQRRAELLAQLDEAGKRHIAGVQAAMRKFDIEWDWRTPEKQLLDRALAQVSLITIGSRVAYRQHNRTRFGVITGIGHECGWLVYDVSLDDGAKHWGYADQFSPEAAEIGGVKFQAAAE